MLHWVGAEASAAAAAPAAPAAPAARAAVGDRAAAREELPVRRAKAEMVETPVLSPAPKLLEVQVAPAERAALARVADYSSRLARPSSSVPRTLRTTVRRAVQAASAAPAVLVQ